MGHGTSPSLDALEVGAALFKALGSPLRLQIMQAVASEPHCVHDLVQITGASQPLVSQHLRVLRNARLLQAEKVGREMQYSLADAHIVHIITDALEHVLECPEPQEQP